MASFGTVRRNVIQNLEQKFLIQRFGLAILEGKAKNICLKQRNRNTKKYEMGGYNRMEHKKKEASIVKKMMLAVAGGFIVGFACLFLREYLNGNGGSGVWNVIEAILFQDITATQGIEGIGLFYIIGQLFMRGLQMAIVPLVITSLVRALCSLANPEQLGRIAGKDFSYLWLLLCSCSGIGGSRSVFCKIHGMV